MNNENKTSEVKSISRIMRFDDQGLLLGIKTFGTGISLPCKVINSSISGLLIGPHKKVLPFQVKTLLEIEIVADKNNHFERDIYFLGKVIRIDDGKGKTREPSLQAPPLSKVNYKYGIQIVDIDDQDMTLWKQHISLLGSAKSA